jgi:hypothetical protein
MDVRFRLPDYVDAVLDSRDQTIDLVDANADAVQLMRQWFQTNVEEIDRLLGTVYRGELGGP